MRVVLTNDDGIDAPGIKALEMACRGWCDVTVVAPDRCHSSMSHHVNTAEAIGVTELSTERFQVTGSPADCARLALCSLVPDADWLIAGINRGGNLGVDFWYSGTIAAAREAALLGRRAMAISHYVARGRELDWEAAARRAERVIRDLVMEPVLADGEFWNVNMPHMEEGAAEPAVVYCPMDTSALPVAFRREPGGYRYCGDYQGRKRLAGHDVARCFGGAITVSRVSVASGLRPSGPV
jgi:5'-nucleotidase